ncbi:hypothetical protein [Cupriavidus basilensis]|uniref:hypothetical protein n=1 Tax=Cupriavidus basilensis TaxID=68895 RepID=UPI001185B9B5|nr:hypothetical protein [Cupriavidus basilensis]
MTNLGCDLNFPALSSPDVTARGRRAGTTNDLADRFGSNGFNRRCGKRVAVRTQANRAAGSNRGGDGSRGGLEDSDHSQSLHDFVALPHGGNRGQMKEKAPHAAPFQL